MAVRKILLPGRDDQQITVLIMLVFLIGSGFYFWQRSITNSGVIDFDDIPARQVEYLVDINRAHWPELANLPGIGEKLARQIVEHRENQGRFETTEQLMDVSGIGKMKLSKLYPHIFVSTTAGVRQASQPDHPDKPIH